MLAKGKKTSGRNRTDKRVLAADKAAMVRSKMLFTDA